MYRSVMRSSRAKASRAPARHLLGAYRLASPHAGDAASDHGDARAVQDARGEVAFAVPAQGRSRLYHVEPVDDRPANARALPDGRVIHHDAVLDRRPGLDDHALTQDRPPDGSAADDGAFAEERVLHLAAHNPRRRSRERGSEDGPVRIVEIEGR